MSRASGYDLLMVSLPMVEHAVLSVHMPWFEKRSIVLCTVEVTLELCSNCRHLSIYPVPANVLLSYLYFRHESAGSMASEPSDLAYATRHSRCD